MKYRLSITLLSTILSIVSLNSAYAGEAGGARFSFAPNVWGGGVKSAGTPEPPIVRKKAVALWHPVQVAKRAPSVPHDASFLGLDNEVLANRVPQPQVSTATQVAIAPTYAQVLPQMTAKPMNGAFKSAFGKPIGSEPAPQIAIAHSLPVASVAIPSVSARLASKPAIRHYNNSRSMLAHAKSLNSSNDSYGKNFGYVPQAGIYSGDGQHVSTSTQVHAQIIKH